ncbi:MAG: hypothetical protein BEN19_06340 [Epulopiscium sp. Nuni2H_MBin003]|nr:MAG: hypothetical protein BEN19_06340 [Epulopiscium sp. Nuni2H_MBin003]
MDVSIDVSHTILETPRCILRIFTAADLADFNEYARVDGVGELAGWKAHKSMEESSEILDMFLRHKNIFAIVHKDDGKVIGSIDLKSSWTNLHPDYKQYKSKDIGYVLSKDYWNNGVMSEAVEKVIESCKEKFGIELLSCMHFEYNLISKKIIEKNGFTYVETESFNAKPLGKYITSLKYVKIL